MTKTPLSGIKSHGAEWGFPVSYYTAVIYYTVPVIYNMIIWDTIRTFIPPGVAIVSPRRGGIYKFWAIDPST